MLRQQRDILFSVTQGRDLEGDHTQTIVEVFPEIPFFDLFGQVHIGCRNHPAIHRDLTQIADPADLAIFQEAQQPHLHFSRNIADFVQKQGPVVRGLDEAFLIADGVRKGPLHMTEQLAFKEPGGGRAAIHHHERMMPPGASFVDQPRHPLLTHPAFPQDEHVDITGGNPFDQFVEFPHGSAFIAGQDLVQRRQTFLGHLRSAAAQQVFHLGHQFAAVEGFGQVVHHAGFDRLHGIGNGAVGGEKNDRKVGAQGADFGEQVHPSHSRHAHIGDDEIQGVGSEDFQRFPTAVGGMHAEPRRAEASFKDRQDMGIIIHNEDSLFRRCRLLRTPLFQGEETPCLRSWYFR